MQFVIIFLPMIFVLFFEGINSRLVKQICGKTRSMWIENGTLKCDVEGEFNSEIPCDSITEFRTSSHLLMLGRFQAPKVIGWYPVPLRVFADEKERDEFVESVRNPQEQTQENTSVLGGEKYFSISFQVGEEEGVRMLADAAEILQTGTLGEKKKGRFVGVSLAAIFVVNSCWAVWLVPNLRIAYIMPFVCVLIFLMQLRKLLESPEKKIRSQIRKGNIMNLIWGNWEISVTETGILQNMSGETNTMMPWESLLCMVEMDTGMFFFQKDKKHFIMLPKQGLESREQIESLKELCREKQVEIIAGKRKKYVPNGLFPILVFIVIMGYMLLNAWLAFRDSQEDIYNDYVPYGYVPYGYDDYNYVSFEKQVSVLRSLGFYISDEQEEIWRGYMEDEDIAMYIEGYPYMGLLGELAWNNDEGEEGVKVFWFDFEGWDISTDYIRVLEGMRELASGSVPDDVRNIREDIEDVDWEKGTGTITVSLEWNGQEYSWKMDVENDWIDGKVQGIYNSLLEKTEIPERFYTTWDGGQGALVFYCTEEWALEFEKATGMEMEAY